MVVIKLIDQLVERRNGYMRARMRAGERGDMTAYGANITLEKEYNRAIAIV